ncbi:MAG: NrtA/SsuA/CpmA family ABC transporter substrate-binding protein [Pyramidobacter sp.]|nr:NrtA/SsuA/CpmA family ABC transporter substrate-binding protein [Pyramidobacter sp.]
MKYTLKICAALLAAVFGLTGAQSASAREFTVKKMGFTYVQSPLNVPSIVQKTAGIFEKAYAPYNLPVEYAPLTSGPEQTAALASGDLQILNAVGGTSVLLAAANGADIKIISMYSRSPAAFMLFSNDASLTSPAHLRGKTIAGPKGTNLHELLAAYLKTGGMSMRDVKFVSMSIPAALAALENGSVDAALQAGPSAYNCIKSGKHLITDGNGLIAALIVTAAQQKFCDENPELVEAFVRAQRETLSFMKAEHAQTMKMTAQATGLDVQAVEEMYGMYDFSMDVTEKDIADFEKTQQFMLDNGMMERAVDVKELFLKR